MFLNSVFLFVNHLFNIIAFKFLTFMLLSLVIFTLWHLQKIKCLLQILIHLFIYPFNIDFHYNLCQKFYINIILQNLCYFRNNHAFFVNSIYYLKLQNIFVVYTLLVIKFVFVFQVILSYILLQDLCYSKKNYLLIILIYYFLKEHDSYFVYNLKNSKQNHNKNYLD